MTTDINVKVFSTDALSAEQKMRLEDLITQLETAAKERKVHLDSAEVKALNVWLKNAESRKFVHDYLPMFNAIPEDRWAAFLDKELEGYDNLPGGAESIPSLKALPIAMQREVVAFMGSQKGKFVNKVADRQEWKKLDGLYETILAEFPDILTNTGDVASAIRLGGILQGASTKLKTDWKAATGEQKIELSRDIFVKAYPDDDVKHIHIASVDLKNTGAGFMSSMEADTIVCGSLFSKGDSSSFPLYLFTHEFQHRRQHRLVDQLENGQLKTGSAEYYQARLFRANFKGGYLTPSTALNKIAAFASFRDYFEQPVEAHANGTAMLAHKAGQTGADILWKFNEVVSKFISDAARPMDYVAYGAKRMVSAVATVGQGAPRGPS